MPTKRLAAHAFSGTNTYYAYAECLLCVNTYLLTTLHHSICSTPTTLCPITNSISF